jgi:hypothetical protein
MSTHPNVLLLLVLTPDDLARKTYRAIVDEHCAGDSEQDIEINGENFHHRVMEEDYFEDSQISAPEGSIILWDLVTYGYGEKITWQALADHKSALESWAEGVCAKHHCKAEIFVSANYW